MSKSENAISIFILIAIIAATAAVYFWRQEFFNLFFSYAPVPVSVQPKASIAKPAEGLGSDIVSQVENPVAGKLPEANPFSAPLNPFESVYKNPFSQ
ncbi:MAG: hypothetical protein HYW34_01890 [Candidatus Brennerbacteria bacterium]|nr:hypothetical protein [Candidatus Brennerbacteria bacterium]